MAEAENLILAFLREVREEIRGTNERLNRMERRIDAMHRNGMKALKSFIGHRTMVERPFVRFDDQATRFDGRVEVLESARA